MCTRPCSGGAGQRCGLEQAASVGRRHGLPARPAARPRRPRHHHGCRPVAPRALTSARAVPENCASRQCSASVGQLQVHCLSEESFDLLSSLSLAQKVGQLGRSESHLQRRAQEVQGSQAVLTALRARAAAQVHPGHDPGAGGGRLRHRERHALRAGRRRGRLGLPAEADQPRRQRARVHAAAAAGAAPQALHSRSTPRGQGTRAHGAARRAAKARQTRCAYGLGSNCACRWLT